ncbi:uncharacterized protein LOC120670545 isoform X3 [Panicum virgatum]|uniref:uncharacterized protein LOC120670545 isoform X3 n=1 Tax=Panicum virgatum TaxID=38727 RepID=UPI0019D60699|nr:uncharacterized protein LOC120670545 isoform X3 [Panicum virgatum]
MDGDSSRCGKLESILQDGSLEPHHLPLGYLRNITNNFSEERVLGEGGFGTVYKYNGKYICAEKSERLLCLEYMPKGNLRGYLSDEASGLGWDTRYKIIEGICCGLHYLHEEWQHSTPIIHMDLKPANILLDDNMVPKIADFGLSRLFSDEKTWTCTINRDGTLGYMAPEYINKGLITTKSDVFSLGVIIIEIVTGHRNYPDENCPDQTPQVIKKWRNRLQKTTSDEELYYYQQIRRCIQIGLVCVDLDGSKRPTTSQIIKMLHVESADLSGRKRQVYPCHMHVGDSGRGVRGEEAGPGPEGEMGGAERAQDGERRGLKCCAPPLYGNGGGSASGGGAQTPAAVVQHGGVVAMVGWTRSAGAHAEEASPAGAASVSHITSRRTGVTVGCTCSAWAHVAEVWTRWTGVGRTRAGQAAARAVDAPMRDADARSRAAGQAAARAADARVLAAGAADARGRAADERARATTRAAEERARSAAERTRIADERARTTMRAAVERARAAAERTLIADERARATMRMVEERTCAAERMADERAHAADERARAMEERSARAEARSARAAVAAGWTRSAGVGTAESWLADHRYPSSRSNCMQ